MAKESNLVFVWLLLLCFFARSRPEQNESVPWYIGCYNNRDVTNGYISKGSSHTSAQRDPMTPVNCVSQCVKRYRYAALRNGSICICLMEIDKNATTNDIHCNTSCHGDKSIKCGGTNASNIYSTSVPLLESLHNIFPNQAAKGTLVTVTSILSIKRLADEVSGLNRIKQGNQTADSIFITWSVQGKVYNDARVHLTGYSMNISKDIIFQQYGSQEVCVLACNLFSFQRKCSHVGVLVPITGLQLVTVFQGGSKVPIRFPLIRSCKLVYFKFMIVQGSFPEFRFDFGDRTVPYTATDSSPDHNSQDYSCMTASHIFRSSGNFTINVTVSNAISRKCQTFNVVVEPFKASIELEKNSKDCLRVEANMSSILKARILDLEGCSVIYKWNFNDSSPNITTSVPQVSHSFFLAHQRYNVTIAAFYDRGVSQTVEQVCPIKRLQGVILKPEKPHVILGTGEETTFTAEVLPAIGPKGNVKIRFHRNDRVHAPLGNLMLAIFWKPGRFIVKAEAENEVSSVWSNELLVFVYEEISGLSIHHDSTVLLGRPSRLTASVKKGTNVTFCWDFEDGSVINTTSTSITHNYTREGEHRINLVASNPLNNPEETSIIVYVTKLPACYPPAVTLLGLNSGKVFRSKELRLEADVGVNCSKADQLIYMWKVTAASGAQEGGTVEPEGVSFTRGALILPPHLLDYGEYYFHLEVRGKNTGLASLTKVRVTVVKSHLVAVIKGGTYAVVARTHEKIVMDASPSYDPDFPDESHLRFHWSCHLLKDKAKSCFNDSRTPVSMSRNQSVLKFQVDWLLEGNSFDSYEFVVTVAKDSRKAKASKILLMNPGRGHLLSTDCLQCDKGIVNPTAPLVIMGLCSSCPSNNTNITYEWYIYHVQLGGSDPPEREEECFSESITNPMIDSVFHGTVTPLTSKPTFYPLRGSRPTSKPLTFKRTAATRSPPKRFGRGRICIDPNFYGPFPATETTRRPTLGVGIGTGSSAGLSTGKGLGTGSGITTTSTNDVGGDNDDKYDNDEVDDLYIPTYIPPSGKLSGSFISFKKNSMRLLEKHTTTGLRSKNFVVLGGYFPPGHMYMVTLKVNDRDTGQKGLASIYFNTSKTPECETCVVTPFIGEALETAFQLTCSEKSSKAWPTSYRISYTVDGLSNEEGERILMYSSYKSEIQFVLPPGLEAFNHTVKIHVTIASDEVQRNFLPTQVRVLPLNMSENVSIEEVLLNKTDGRLLSLLGDTGDDQGIRQFITALANSLNRLGSVKNVSSRYKMRTDIREKLLQRLLNITGSDKNSAFQTSLALQMLTARPEELTETSVKLASLLLQHLSDMMQSAHQKMRGRRIEGRFVLSEELIKAITRVTSDLIEASSLLILRTKRPHIKKEIRDDFLLKATEAAEKLVKARLSVQVLGEKPLLLNSPKIRVNASQIASIDNTIFSHAAVKFHVPVNLEKHLGGASAAAGGSCYGAVMIVYKENPFYSEMHHSQVGSLSLTDCNGEDIEVRNLSRGIDIFMPHELNKTTQRMEKFTLRWKHENIHVINETKKMSNQVLHVHLEPLSKLPAGFAVKLIVSTAEPGSSVRDQNELTASISGEGGVNMNIRHDQFKNGSESVFVRVVMEDRAYYRIRSINKGHSFTYLLSVHWTGCFYWNKMVKEWSTEGCRMIDLNTPQMFHCRCNHLTAFSGAFLYPPNSLTIKDLTDPVRLKRSPLALVLVVVILLLYLFLIGFCIRADKHDNKKAQAVYITENTSGNNPKAPAITERFQITLQTGHWFGSGTSANVFLILYGDNCVSDPIELKSDRDHPLFERSSCDVFVVSFPGRKFRDICKIHIWHDNSGDDPSWFLEQVIIKDVNRGDTRVFNCNRWLAVDEADGKVECEFKETTNHLNSFKKCFFELSAKSISDYHLWFSLFGRPSYSRFSRAQRLTSCMSLLLSFLCANIAWYRPEKQVMEVLGLLDITGESLWIGVLCSLVALPLNLLWIFLFRYSRRKFRRHVKVYPMSERQTDSTELITSVLDHSLETVGMLTNISERKRWFRTVFEWDDVDSDSSSCMCGSQLSLDRDSDSISRGYNSGHGGLSSSKRPFPPHADLLETCDFLREIGPSHRKSLDFEKRSTYSVSLLSEDRGVYHSRFSLPHGCIYLAWFGCLSTAFTAALFTIWYGVSLGWDLSVRWLQSLFFSLLESFLISQPFMVVIFILYMAYKSNARKEDEDIDEGFEDLSSSALHDIHYGHINQGFNGAASSDGDDLHPALALRRRQRYLKFLKPPSKSKLSEARSKCARSKALKDYTVEVIVSILFFLITCFLVSSITCPDVYHLNQSIRKAFFRPGEGDPDSVKAAWEGMSAAFYENNATSHYTPFTILLRDSQSLLFGRTMITQFKTTMSKSCDGNANTTVCHITCHEKEGAWFSLELNQTSEESAKQLRGITDSQWINICTREVKVEFAVYTPFLRAVSAATLSVKASYTGKPLCRLELNTFPVFFKSTGQGFFVRICKLLFVFLLLYLFQHEFFLAKKMSAKYFRSFWRLTQLLAVASASLSMVLYIRWSVNLYALLREVQTGSQTDVFHYAKMVSSSQEALQALYSLLLFFIIVRSLHMLRPFRTMVRLSKYFASVVRLLAACSVGIIILIMTFVHTGHLLFGGLHTMFKSFGDTFLLVSNFFRLEGVNHYQGPAVEERPVLILFYFAVFVVGFYTFMRGASATVFLYRVPHYKKKRHKKLAVEEFFRSKMQLLREKLKRRESDASFYPDEEEEDEKDEGEEELEEYEKDAPFPMEHVLDEVQVQFEELSLRMGNLMGSEVFDNSERFKDDFLSGTDSDEDVEYLYQAEPRPVPSAISGSGYESDHSNMSAARWNLSSSSCYDLADCHGPNEPRSGLVRGTSAIPVMFTSGGCKASPSLRKITAYPEEETSRFQGNSNPSCSSSYDMCRSNPSFTLRDDGLREGALLNTRLRDGVLRGGFLFDGVWHVGGLHDSSSRGNDPRDRPDVESAAQSDGAFSRDQSFYSTHVVRPETEPIMPKNVYSMARTHGRRCREALSLHPCADVDCSTTEVATSSASELEVGRKDKKSRRRKSKALFRSSAVYPGEEGLSLGPNPPVRGREAHSTDSPHLRTKSPVHAAWGLAPSASERGFVKSPASHAYEDSRLHAAAQILVPSSPERGFVADPCHEALEDSDSIISARELDSTASPDPYVPEGPLKGILGDISMNRPLGTEIFQDDLPSLSTAGEKYKIR